MAITITIADRSAAGNRFTRRGTGNLGAYATNGVSFTKANFDFPVAIQRIEVDAAAGYVFEVDSTNSKIKAYIDKTPAAATPLAEVGNAVDLSAVTFNWYATGN